MRMHIPQDKTELREFVDDLLRTGVGQIVIMDDPGSSPPPPTPGIRVETARDGRCVQLFDIKETHEGGRKPSSGMEHFQQDFEIAHECNEHPPQQPISPGRPGSPTATRAVILPHQGIDQAQRFRKRKRNDGGQAQIESLGGHDPRQFSQHVDQHVPEIIVADAIARQPGVPGRKGQGMKHPLDKRDLHGFFCARDIGIKRAEIGPTGHDEEK